MLVDIVKRVKVINPETKRVHTVRELSCGHTQVQVSGGRAQGVMFARCRECGKKSHVPTELERMHTPMA